MVLDRAGVLGGVGAAKVELRARRGELEAKDTGRDGALADEGVEEGGLREILAKIVAGPESRSAYLAEVGDGGVRQAKNPVNGIISE